jgi:hypothetical protein
MSVGSCIKMVAGRLRPWTAAVLMGGLLAGAACTTAPAGSSGASAAVVQDIPGCVEEQRATWTDGSVAPWVACHSRTGIIGIEGSTAINGRCTIFMAAATPDANGQTALARSRDGGRTWQRVPLPVEFSHIIGYVQADPATNRLFYKSIARMLPIGGPGFGTTNPIGYSDDEGETWHVTRIGGAANGEPDTLGDMGAIFVGPPPAGTMTSGYPNVVYTCDFSPRASAPTSNVQCWRSLDGGQSFHRPDPANATLPRATAPGCTADGYIFPNRGLVAPNGTVYLPVSRCGQWVVGVSTDAGKTFTWTAIPGAVSVMDREVLAEQERTTPGCAGSVAYAGCPEGFKQYGQSRLAMDASGTLYFIVNTHQLMLSMSKDGGRSWSEPTPMSLPGVQTVWSSIAARGPGEIGLSYLGRSEGSHDWHGYMAIVEHADDPHTRNIATARVSALDNPLMPFRCCGSQTLLVPEGSPEGGFYNLMEHGGLNFAPDGSLWATFFRDNTRDPHNTRSAAYEIVAGHMAPIGAMRREQPDK